MRTLYDFSRSLRRGSQANIRNPKPRASLATPHRCHYGAMPDCRYKEVGRAACMCNDCFDKLCAIAEVMGTPMPEAGR